MLLANLGVSGPVKDGVGLVPTQGYLKYSRPKLTSAQPLKAVVQKCLPLMAVRRRGLFFP